MTGPERLSRRTFLGMTGGSLAGLGLAGCMSSTEDRPAVGEDAAAPGLVTVDATGAHQAGIAVPAAAQPNLLTLVFDLRGPPAPVVAALGHVVLSLTRGSDPHLAGMDPGDLTVTVGVGPRLVAAVDPSLPGASALPAFPRERLAKGDSGDVMVQICAGDPLLLPGCHAAIARAGGRALSERWRQHAFRGPAVAIDRSASAPRNLLGFVDGIVGPRTQDELAADVWLAKPRRVAAATICVVRRMEIDVERFLDLSVSEQEATIGRRRATAAPLSGGTIATDPDLRARTAAGVYLIPATAHLRRASPLATGVPTMLRRSYSFQDTAEGIFFVSFQADLSTFVATLNRMSSSDALLEFTTTTRSGTFLMLGGFDSETPLGATLFGV